MTTRHYQVLPKITYLSAVDRYGEGIVLAIEPAAAFSEDTRRQIYD